MHVVLHAISGNHAMRQPLNSISIAACMHAEVKMCASRPLKKEHFPLANIFSDIYVCRSSFWVIFWDMFSGCSELITCWRRKYCTNYALETIILETIIDIMWLHDFRPPHKLLHILLWSFNIGVFKHTLLLEQLHPFHHST